MPAAIRLRRSWRHRLPSRPLAARCCLTAAAAEPRAAAEQAPARQAGQAAVTASPARLGPLGPLSPWPTVAGASGPTSSGCGWPGAPS